MPTQHAKTAAHARYAAAFLFAVVVSLDLRLPAISAARPPAFRL
jgi:energy-converting hydrogenase Eha subunit A